MHTSTLPSAAEQLLELVGRIEAAEGFESVVASLRAGHGATLDGVWGSSCALAAAALARHASGPLVVVCPHQGDSDEFADDLALFTREKAEKFPAWESLPTEQVIKD